MRHPTENREIPIPPHCVLVLQDRNSFRMKITSLLPLALCSAFSVLSLTPASAEDPAPKEKKAPAKEAAAKDPAPSKESRGAFNKAMQEAGKDPEVSKALKEAKKLQLEKAKEIDPSIADLAQKELERLDKPAKDAKAPKEPKAAKEPKADKKAKAEKEPKADKKAEEPTADGQE